MEPDEHFTDHISGDVLKVLRDMKFFECLDDCLCPVDTNEDHVARTGDYRQTTIILAGMDFDQQDISDVVGVLASQGGCCDCEILFNVAASSRLKSSYWKTRLGDQTRGTPHHPGKSGTSSSA